MELKIKGNLTTNNIPSGNETSLKQVFDENINNYWTRVFKGHSPKEPPSYRYELFNKYILSPYSVFRKTMNIEADYFEEF
jgi:hypothetical protein